ncbi:hypothetical protein F4808DRAFT_76232 [Astrocystis sublimbata]|nr:hypothetical protein F4808DRAFT_76232 [Astrocystis sublimbata]
MDLDRTPALEPPANVDPAFSQSSGVLPLRYAVSAVALFLCAVFVTIRIYVRVRIQRVFNLDDFAVLASFAGFIAFTVVVILAGQKGDGKHQWDVSVSQFQDILLLLNVVEILYGPTIFAAKYAILRQIESIFFSHRQDTRTYKAIRILIWANLAYYLATTLVYILACVPREKIWNPMVAGRCISQADVIVLTPVLNVISDITILVVPVAEVFKLHMPLKTKLGVAAIFAVGALSLVAGIVRLYYSVLLKQSPDLTWNLPPVGHWAIAEFVTVILIACLPYVAPLLRFHRSNTAGSSYQLPSADKSANSRHIRSGYQRDLTPDDNSIKALRSQASRGRIDVETRIDIETSFVK